MIAIEDIDKIEPYVRPVFYYETDRMGIVHHSNYIRWMEEARMDWMDKIGWNYKHIEDEGIIIPVLGVSTQYKTMSRYGDTIEIHTYLSEYTGVRVGFFYEICDKENGELRCLGTSSHCLLDSDNKILFMKKQYPEEDKLFKALLKEYKEKHEKKK